MQHLARLASTARPACTDKEDKRHTEYVDFTRGFAVWCSYVRRMYHHGICVAELNGRADRKFVAGEFGGHTDHVAVWRWCDIMHGCVHSHASPVAVYLVIDS